MAKLGSTRLGPSGGEGGVLKVGVACDSSTEYYVISPSLPRNRPKQKVTHQNPNTDDKGELEDEG